MLGTYDASIMLPVKDLAEARRFYGETLGLKSGDTHGEMAIYATGETSVVVYRSDYAGTNQATAATWQVDDLPAIVDALRGRGVAFERYDMPGFELIGDYYAAGEMKLAWFKDPAGNILGLYSRS